MKLQVPSEDATNDNDIIVFHSNRVKITRIGDTGAETYEMAKLTIETMTDQDMKGRIVARNLAGNVLVFNGIICGNMPVRKGDEMFSIWFGKVPSLSYVDDNKKPIPTFWSARFFNVDEFQRFVGLLQVFSRLADEVNSRKTTKKYPPCMIPEKFNPFPSTFDNSSDTEASEKADSVNLLDSDTDGESATVNETPNKRLSYDFFSPMSETSISESPIFAQSQDVYTSLGRTRPTIITKNMSCFSPLE